MGLRDNISVHYLVQFLLKKFFTRVTLFLWTVRPAIKWILFQNSNILVNILWKTVKTVSMDWIFLIRRSTKHKSFFPLSLVLCYSDRMTYINTSKTAQQFALQKLVPKIKWNKPSIKQVLYHISIQCYQGSKWTFDFEYKTNIPKVALSNSNMIY